MSYGENNFTDVEAYFYFGKFLLPAEVGKEVASTRII
jgi:hypothetical protein